MPTMTEVKQQRKAFDGRDTYERFVTHCKSRSVEPTEDALAEWDGAYNHFAIRDNYGSKEDVYALGLRTMYQRFLVNNCFKIAVGNPVVLPSGLRYQPTVNERRATPVGVFHARSVTAQQLNIIRDQFRAELRQLLRTQKFFNLPAAEIRELVSEALEETLSDKK